MLGYIQALIDVNERELSRMISNVHPTNPVVKQQEIYIKQLKDLKEFYIKNERPFFKLTNINEIKENTIDSIQYQHLFDKEMIKESEENKCLK